MSVARPDTAPARGLAATRRQFAQWFALDLRSLAVFRIGLGLLLLTDLIGRAGDLTAHYTDQGVLPRSALPAGRYVSLHLLDGTADFQAALFVLAGLFALALLLGWWTRAAAVGSWFLLMSLHARNPMILHGGDNLLRVLLFWAMFLPLGARWSLDGPRQRGGRPPGDRVVSMGSAALVLQICFVYWFSAALKSDPAWRSEGTAVYYALSIEQFATPLAHSLLGFPGLLRALTFATLALEAVGPALLFVPFFAGRVRLAVVAGFLLFHLMGLRLCLELGSFPWVCAVAWLALLPGGFWDGAARLARRPRWLDWLAARGAAGAGQPAPLLLNVLAACFLAYVFLWNLRTTDPGRWGRVLPSRADFIATTFGIDQVWDMFAPGPMKDSGWLVARGTRRDGTPVDLLRDGAPVCWDQPPLVSATYVNERWRKYLMNLWVKDNAPHRVLYVRYLLREWNARHEGGSAMESAELYFMLKRTLPDYRAARPEKVLLCATSAAAPEQLTAGAVP